MNLSERHRHFLFVEQGVHALMINIVINGVIAWALLRSHEMIPLWGEPSMGIDLLATGMLLPFFMTQIVSRIVAGQVRSGKLPALSSDQIAPSGIHRRSIHVRSLILAVAGITCFSAPLVWILDAAGAQPVPLMTFVAFKAVWAGLLAMMISPILAWWSLSAVSAEGASTPLESATTT
jgi:hypothetical protein